MAKKEEHEDMHYKLASTEIERVENFRALPVNNQGFTLLHLSRKIRQELLYALKNDEIVQLLHYLAPDDATDLLQYLDQHRRNRILGKLTGDIKDKVELLLKFNPRTAAGMMSLDYIEVDEKSTFADVSKVIKKHEKRTGRFPAILIVGDGFLVGELPGSVFAYHTNKERITKHVKRASHIRYDTEESEVVQAFKRHPHNKIVVIDDDDSILGVIYSDDVLQVIQKQPGRNLYDFAGVSSGEDVLDSAFTKVKYRYKWLIINLGTAFLAASVVSLFQETISAFVLLAVYMPIVAGMGGNAGTQTMAVMVRGIALKEVELKTARKVILNEMLAGATNGLITGILVAIVATLLNQNPLLGLIIGTALVVNLLIAGFFGSTIPLLMKRLGKDPATSATIFITTATDVLGFFVFLSLAAMLL